MSKPYPRKSQVAATTILPRKPRPTPAPSISAPPLLPKPPPLPLVAQEPAIVVEPKPTPPVPTPTPTPRVFAPGAAMILLRPYQRPVFDCRETGILILHWARQIGKSFTLAAWAVDRAIERPGHLVTVLSNSRENGAEFLEKCTEVCRLLENTLREHNAEFESHDLSEDFSLANMRLELRFNIKVDDGSIRTSRIKVLAANPRTARGFSGDLILDEFAFHENSAAIWEAAEPILSANRDFLCCIASTGNGKHNMFYRMAACSAQPATPANPP